MHYEYRVIEFPTEDLSAALRLGSSPDMEGIYFPDWLTSAYVEQAAEAAGHRLWGAWYGGMFGLATNRFIVLTVGETDLSQPTLLDRLGTADLKLAVTDCQRLHATVRPLEHTPVERTGLFVFRWLRLVSGQAQAYTDLCNQTWPRFQRDSDSECLALWRIDQDDARADMMLMCTWYENLAAWERSRDVAAVDAPKWRLRAGMELSHWGIGARRMP